ncbi:hypothetical protein BKP57_02090 [Virgibacillus sp. 6R]|nr:hypothetical protein BKP57_02090 [Virgibacillus sp. 6R]
MGSWVLTRYDDCKYVLRNPKLFALDKRRVEDQSDTMSRLQSDVQKNLQSLDPPPENRPIRSLMMKAFNSQDIANIRQEVREHIKEIFDKLTPNTEFDFMKEVSAPLSLRHTIRSS